MERIVLVVACFAYSLGLGSAFLLGDAPTLKDWGLLTLSWLGLTAIAAVVMPRYWHGGPNYKSWLLMGLIAWSGAVYCHLRLPQPSPQDISRQLLPPLYRPQTVTVTGQLLNNGQESRTGYYSFRLQAQLLQKDPEPRFRPVDGQIYLTLKDSDSQYHACQKVRVRGQIYRPLASAQGFDFSEYLASQGVFAGLRAQEVTVVGTGNCWFFHLRQAIITRQSAWLPRDEQGRSPEGLLLGSIVLGQKAVSLPFELRHLFAQVGLSHLLAASGYQVSLLLGAVLQWSQNFAPQLRLGWGGGTLGFYLGLTGLQPSVLRASLMWGGILWAEVHQRKIRPLGALLLVATLLLLVQPRWWGDLGFQLSFLATFGIMVTAPYWQKQWTYLPPQVAEILAVPLAATLWTTPLLLAQFSQFIWAAIPLNIVVTPLVAIISLGGMVSAVGALILPALGSAIAWLLYYPLKLLIWLAQGFQGLPAIATGQLQLWQLGLVYGLFIAICFWPRRYWGRPLMALTSVAIVVVPSLWQSFAQTKITLFHHPHSPVMLIRQPLRVTLIHSLELPPPDFFLKPYLAQQGINRIDCSLIWGQNSASPCPRLHSLQFHPHLVELTFKQQRWWLVQTRDFEPLPSIPVAAQPTVLIWTGPSVPLAWLEQLRPPLAVALSSHISPSWQRKIQALGIKLWITGSDGPLYWTPQQGFHGAINTNLR